jgi:DNA helicase HerA-like ATPase
VRTAAETFRPNPDFDCADAITKLGTGEALVSTLEQKGIPSMVQRTLIRPPASRLGPVTPEERRQVMAQSPVAGQYDTAIDRESAFEILQKRASQAKAEAEARKTEQETSREKDKGGWSIPGFETKGRQSVAEAAIKSIVRSVGSQVGRALVRGILGSLTKR